jgi:hypothetical protein
MTKTETKNLEETSGSRHSRFIPMSGLGAQHDKSLRGLIFFAAAKRPFSKRISQLQGPFFHLFQEHLAAGNWQMAGFPLCGRVSKIAA